MAPAHTVLGLALLATRIRADEATDDDEDESMGHGEDEEEGPPNKKRRISGRMEFKINQEEWWNRYLDTITKAQKIVRGRYPNTSSYKQGLKLAQEHCSKFSGVWNKLEEKRKTIKKYKNFDA